MEPTERLRLPSSQDTENHDCKGPEGQPGTKEPDDQSRGRNRESGTEEEDRHKRILDPAPPRFNRGHVIRDEPEE